MKLELFRGRYRGMSKTPRLSAKEIIAALGRAGFVIARIKGSHHFLKHPDGRKTVPVHSSETIGPACY